MTWNLDSSKPIYMQIIEHIQMEILSGVYLPGDKLASVRDMAAKAGVNPNTMQRALAELEREGFLYSVRTSGRFITEDESRIEDMKERVAENEIREFMSKMKLLGFDYKMIIQLIEKTVQEEKQ